nr:MAG TPA: hypothetical protein [Caudoviricetes sp.]
MIHQDGTRVTQETENGRDDKLYLSTIFIVSGLIFL